MRSRLTHLCRGGYLRDTLGDYMHRRLVKRLIKMKTSTSTVALLAISILALSGCGGADDGNSTTVMIDLLPDQIAGRLRSDTTDTYDRETIFDYINGAGEVYRSYAFGDVLVARYSGPDVPDLLVELFDMGSPADAYGVFSYAREQEAPGIGGGYEHKGRVLCFWQDRYYTCLTIDGTPSESDTSLLEGARAVAGQLPPITDRPDLIAKLPSEGLVAFSERFFHIHQSLNYHYYLARENILDLSAETDAVLARYEPGTTYLLIVRYESEGKAARALSSFRGGYLSDSPDSGAVQTENGKWVSSRDVGSYVVVVLDAPSETAATSLLQTTVDGLTEPSS